MTRKQFLRLLGFGVVAASLPKLPVAEAAEVATPMELSVARMQRKAGIFNLEPFDFDRSPYQFRRWRGPGYPVEIVPHPEMKR